MKLWFAIQLSVFCVVLFVGDEVAYATCQCPTVTGVEDFNLKETCGLWYEMGRLYSSTQTPGKCVTYDISCRSKPCGTMKIVIRQLTTATLTLEYTEGFFSLADRCDYGRVAMSFPSSSSLPSTDYYVLAQGCNCILIYSCICVDGVKQETGWILCKQSTICPKDQKIISQALTDNGLYINNFLISSHDCTCTY